MPNLDTTDDLSLVDTSGAMEILGMNRVGVLRLIDRDVLPYVQRGKRGVRVYLFKRADVERVRDMLGEYRRLGSALGFRWAS